MKQIIYLKYACIYNKYFHYRHGIFVKNALNPKLTYRPLYQQGLACFHGGLVFILWNYYFRQSVIINKALLM